MMSSIDITETGYLISSVGKDHLDYFVKNRLVNEQGDDIDMFVINEIESAAFTLNGSNDSFITAGILYFEETMQGDFYIIKTCKASPMVALLADSTYCPPGIVTATAGLSGYRWTKGMYTDTVFFASGNQIEVFEGGNYNVTAYNANGCPSYSSIVVPDPLFTPQKKDLCFVTVDQVTGNNKIIFSAINPQSIVDSIYVYRTNEFNQHVIIGRMSMDENEFIDYTSMPSHHILIFGQVILRVQH